MGQWVCPYFLWEKESRPKMTERKAQKNPLDGGLLGFRWAFLPACDAYHHGNSKAKQRKDHQGRYRGECPLNHEGDHRAEGHIYIYNSDTLSFYLRQFIFPFLGLL
ncbi:hypothetical protein CBW1004CProp1_gp17 [Phage CBW1004C-Prop1]|nr:hypothetical protein CBW1004CProp1_gp17 [Phage CBW1004C-Prop1]